MSKIQEALKRIRSAKESPDESLRAPKRDQREWVDNVETDLINGGPPRTLLKNSNEVVTIDLEVLAKRKLAPYPDQASEIDDQYRQIKRPLIKSALGLTADGGAENRNLIMVASALPGDGKTFTAINLALSMASEQDATVLLVDADIPKRNISKVLGIDQKLGLIDLIVNEDLDINDAILPTNVKGLSVLPSGPVDALTTELLASRRMKRIANQLSKRLPDCIVIFDSPPILATSQAPVLASLLGQVIVVVRAGHTPQSAFRLAIELIEADKPIGIVLNAKVTSGSVVDNYYGSYSGLVD